MRSSVDTACSGSSEEIKIGAGVLDYISELGNRVCETFSVNS